MCNSPFIFFKLYLILLGCQEKEAIVIVPHDELEIRFYRTNAHKEKLNPFFQQTKGISERRAKFYVGWLKRLLGFYRGRFSEVSE
jgi:hypothetical protein